MAHFATRHCRTEGSLLASAYNFNSSRNCQFV